MNSCSVVFFQVKSVKTTFDFNGKTEENDKSFTAIAHLIEPVRHDVRKERYTGLLVVKGRGSRN